MNTLTRNNPESRRRRFNDLYHVHNQWDFKGSQNYDENIYDLDENNFLEEHVKNQMNFDENIELLKTTTMTLSNDRKGGEWLDNRNKKKRFIAHRDWIRRSWQNLKNRYIKNIQQLNFKKEEGEILGGRHILDELR